MPNHEIPIEQASLWDILDWDAVAVLASQDTGDPRDGAGENLYPALATMLVEAAARGRGKEDEALFHKIASHGIGFGKDAVRRQKAGQLAARFGARPDRLIEYLAYKWGVFKRG